MQMAEFDSRQIHRRENRKENTETKTIILHRPFSLNNFDL